MSQLVKVISMWALVTLLHPFAYGSEIVVGQVTPLQKPTDAGNLMRAGIELYFDQINRTGGVGGAKLKLVTKDRGYTSADAVIKTKELVNEIKPIALIGMTGTGPMEALVKEKVVVDAAIPYVGIRTGATSLHTPVNPWLFHTRANYGIEAKKIVEHLVPIGFKRFAVFYEDSAFGRAGLKLVETALIDAKLPILAQASYEFSTVHVAAAVQTIARAQPDAVIAIGDTNGVAEFYKALRQTGSRPQVVALSTVDAVGVVNRIGQKDAHGLGITQVVPDPMHRKTAIAREYQDSARKLRPETFELTQAGIEGYIAAKVLVEGLKLAGSNPTPAQLRTSLEKLNGVDMGGVFIKFSASDHSGSSFVNVGIIGANGRLLQ